MLLFTLFILGNISLVYCFSGLSPNEYCSNAAGESCFSKIGIFTNRLYSPVSIVPFSPSWFDQCVSETEASASENLGQIVFGEHLLPVGINMDFKKPAECIKLCSRTYSPKDAASLVRYQHLVQGIRDAYQRYWIADNLPVTVCEKYSNEICERSFPIGCFANDAYKKPKQCRIQFSNALPGSIFVFNHFDFKVKYTSSGGEGTDRGQLIAVQVKPQSIARGKTPTGCFIGAPFAIPAQLKNNITIDYTYSVVFEEDSKASWSSRWDYLISVSSRSNIHWLSIVNSIIVVIFLTFLVAMVLIRTLRRDFSKYNTLENMANESQEESGWKLIHADVFRSPSWPMLLSVLVGSGTQLALASTITLFFACFGILAPAHRGALATCAIAVFVCLGASAGYTSALLYKTFRGVRWKTNVLMTGLFCPGFVVTFFLFLNVILTALHSSAAVPFTSILVILAMWLLVSLPLCFIGSFFGFRRPAIEVPTRTNQIPRKLPRSTCRNHACPAVLLAGALSFVGIFIQLFFIMNSIWGHQLFFMFGFLFVVFVVLLVSTAETSILMCYFQLCDENYKWWWRSFITGGGTTLYILLYSIHYYIYKTEYRGFTSAFLYFICTGLVTGLLFLMLGSVGFLCCFAFVRKIYGVVKVD